MLAAQPFLPTVFWPVTGCCCDRSGRPVAMVTHIAVWGLAPCNHGQQLEPDQFDEA
jgi:hypothetical protein